MWPNCEAGIWKTLRPALEAMGIGGVLFQIEREIETEMERERERSLSLHILRYY